MDLEKVDYCKDMLKKAEEKGVSLLLPVDTTVASAFPDPIDAEIAVEVVDSDKIPADMMGLDIGPKTMELFCRRGEERQAPLCGTAPWACSRTRFWPPAPRR